MQATRLRVLACLGLAFGAALSSCGDDTSSSGGVTVPCERCGGAAGEPATAPNLAGSGGAPDSLERGGRDSMTPTGAMAGAGASEGGGSSGPMGEQLAVCDRLTGLVTHADAVGRVYAKAIFADCSTSWLVPLQQDALVNFRNGLVLWSLGFWGCAGYEPVSSFGLVYQTPPLSEGDVTLLIQHYLSAAQTELALSPPEFADMQAALERLARPLVVSTSPDPSEPRCDNGVGGAAAGGAGAAGAGGANAGGDGGAGAVAGVEVP